MSLNPTLFLRTALNAPVMRIRDFRFLFTSAIFEANGLTGEMLLLGWLALELTDSALMVGVTLGLRTAPFFFLGIPAGAIADRVSRRDLMRVLSAGMFVVMSTVGFLLLSGQLQPWHLYLSAVCTGSLGAVYQASRQSFTFDVAGAGNLLSGLAFVGLGMRIGGLVGAFAVGFLIEHVAPGAAYLMLAAGYLASAGSLSFIRNPGAPAPSDRQSMLSSLKEFGVELRHNRSLLVLIFITAGNEVLGFSTAAALPSLARDVLEVGADGLGFLTASRSAGAIVAISLVAPMGDVGRKGLLLLITMIVFGAAIVALGLSSTLGVGLLAFAVALLAIAVIGGMMSLTDLFSQSLMQSVVRNSQRGRAMGAWVVGVGTAPVGSLQVGFLAATFSVTVALFANGVGLAIMGVAILVLLPKVRRL